MCYSVAVAVAVAADTKRKVPASIVLAGILGRKRGSYMSRGEDTSVEPLRRPLEGGSLLGALVPRQELFEEHLREQEAEAGSLQLSAVVSW